MRVRTTIAAVLLLVATTVAYGANGVSSSEKIVKEIPLDLAGSFWIDNPTGDIDIIGSDTPNITMTAVKIVYASDRAALDEGRDATQISIEGDAAVRLVRTVAPAVRNPRWSSKVTYSLRVPRWVHVKVASKSADRIRVSGIIGNVTIKGFNGTITLDGVTGASVVDTTNGSIVYRFAAKPSAHAQLTTLNGDIEVQMPGDASFDWVADTLRGDLRTTLPVRGHFNGTVFHGSVNSPGGPVLTTKTLLGRVVLLMRGTHANEARSVTQSAKGVEMIQRPQGQRPEQTVRIPMVSENFIFSTNIGNIEVGEIRGFARVDTRAGEVEIGKVWGDCSVTSLGGPLNLGDIIGSVIARTQAGDVLVRAAREGGQIQSGGGSVRLLYTGGPTSLRSGGGDIVVRQAAGPIDAETRSGDITINADPNVRTLHMEAHVTLGNITVNLPPRFAAEIDATVITSAPDTNTINTDFPGLAVRRELVGTKTKIHVTGRINGGGEKLLLYAEEGSIHLTTQTGAAISVTP
jgi:DUF4097 and DUF4098 domain-containing protein YvlB